MTTIIGGIGVGGGGGGGIGGGGGGGGGIGRGVGVGGDIGNQGNAASTTKKTNPGVLVNKLGTGST